MKCLYNVILCLAAIGTALCGGDLRAQETQRRWDQMCQIQKEKFDSVLPRVMRDNKIDMWIVAVREGNQEPNQPLLGEGYVPSRGYYVFTDSGGGRIERATLRITYGRIATCGAYDLVAVGDSLKSFVEKRNPKVIGVDIATEIGTADGLSHSMYNQLVADLGDDLAKRIVPAEKMVSEFRSQLVPAELSAYAKAAEYTATVQEGGLSNKAVTPDRTTTVDVAAWINDRLIEHGLLESWHVSAVMVQNKDHTGNAIEGSLSNSTVIRRGDVLSVDGGNNYLNMWTDMKRMAYVLKPGETAAPAGLQKAYDRALAVRETVTATIKPGTTAEAMLGQLLAAINAMPGFHALDWAKGEGPGDDPAITYVSIGCHATGDLGHGSGPSMIYGGAAWRLREGSVLRANNPVVIEFFASTAVPEWGGARVVISLEDDAVVTQTGVSFVYPPGKKLLLIH